MFRALWSGLKLGLDLGLAIKVRVRVITFNIRVMGLINRIRFKTRSLF